MTEHAGFQQAMGISEGALALAKGSTMGNQNPITGIKVQPWGIRMNLLVFGGSPQRGLSLGLNSQLVTVTGSQPVLTDRRSHHAELTAERAISHLGQGKLAYSSGKCFWMLLLPIVFHTQLALMQIRSLVKRKGLAPSITGGGVAACLTTGRKRFCAGFQWHVNQLPGSPLVSLWDVFVCDENQHCKLALGLQTGQSTRNTGTSSAVCGSLSSSTTCTGMSLVHLSVTAPCFQLCTGEMELCDGANIRHWESLEKTQGEEE